MKKAEKIDQFIILRAQGQSLAAIAGALEISKSTAAEWHKEYSEAIEAAQAQRTAELQDLYRREKEEHRQHLKNTLHRIDAAIDAKDLAEIPADKLLKIKLEYLDRLNAAPPQIAPAADFEEYNAAELLQALARIYKGIQDGTIPPQQSRAALDALDAIRKGLEYRSDNQLSDSLLNTLF